MRTVNLSEDDPRITAAAETTHQLSAQITQNIYSFPPDFIPNIIIMVNPVQMFLDQKVNRENY